MKEKAEGKKTKTIKIRKRYLVFLAMFLGAILVVTVISTIANWRSTASQMNATFKVQVEERVAHLVAEVERQYAVLDGYAAAFAKDDIADKQRLIGKMDKWVYNTEYYAVSFVYPDGTLCRSDGTEINVSDREYYTRVMQGESVIQVLDYSRIDTDIKVGLMVPVRIDNEIQGILIGTYEKKDFEALFEKCFSGLTSLAYICDADGKYVIGTKAAEEVMERYDPGITKTGGFVDVLEEAEFFESSKEEIRQNMKSGMAGQAVYQYRDDRRHTTYVPVGINGWYVVTVLQKAQVYDEVMRMAGGSYITMLVLMASILIIIVFLVFREHGLVIQEVKKRREINYRFEHDDLTGLLREKPFYEKVQKQLEGVNPGEYCLIYMDIYKFKLIDEMFGYDVGDELLRSMAKNLWAFADNYGGLCARISGDKFALFVPYDKNIIMALNTKEYKQKRIIPVELYIHYGVYVINHLDMPVARMVDYAQIAQKTIKGNYDNYIAFYDDKIKEQNVKEQEIITSMSQALEDGEFIIYLQPQYDYRDGKICGAEALVRWDRPGKGLVSPADFIPIFETNGFIIRLDENIWEQVCKLQRKWLDEGREIFPISVNVSRVDLLKGSIAEKIIGLIKKYELTSDMLRVEITESAYMDNPQQLINEINKLQEYGIVVEMDDFGSGYSSLNMLKDVPLHILKTDLRFLAAGGIGTRKERILDNVIRMAHEMGMSVIAEGVETKEQADYLLKLNCDQMQGYYFSRPIPVEAYEKMLYSE